MPITNEILKSHSFLAAMFKDSYFPKPQVEKGKQILIALCERIEAEKPTDLAALYALTHAATEQFNDLAEEFEENDSEIETAARECICADVSVIAAAYGFADADHEELTVPRDW